MATAKGIVIAKSQDRVWVKTIKSASCDGCSAKGQCSGHGDDKEFKIEALNTRGASRGDHVVISFDNASLMKISFLLYIVPVLFLGFGAFLGQSLSGFLPTDPTASSAISGLCFLALSLFLIKPLGNNMAGKDLYKPQVIKILKDQEGFECSINSTD